MQETKYAHGLADLRQAGYGTLAFNSSNDCFVDLRFIRSVVAAGHNSSEPLYAELSPKDFDREEIMKTNSWRQLIER
jgi:hypothetical protein